MKKGFSLIELLFVLALIVVLAGNFVFPTATPEAAPRHENSVNQKFIKVPPEQLNEWLAACKERVVCITPLLRNVLNDLIIDNYLVVTEAK